MGLGGTKEDALAGQHAAAVLDALLMNSRTIRVFVPVLMTCFSSWEPSKLISSTSFLQDQLLLVFQRDGAFADALHLEPGLDLHDLEVAEIGRFAADRLFEGVGKSGEAIFAVEELEGVVVDDVGGGGRQTEGDRLEVIENFTVGVVNGTVAFIDDDEIEEVRREMLCFVPDDVEHRRIGGHSKCGDPWRQTFLPRWASAARWACAP